MIFMGLYFILALLLLVTVHEYGHFLIARCCGVKVLRFSFGFGKVLARWHDKRGTEYTWSLIPLGGYVKMLDEAEGDVPDAERHMAFNNKSVWVRIAIVLGGPLFNLLFAFLALWMTLMIGVQSLVPIIDAVKPNSIAAQAGLTAKQEILSINDQNVLGWRDVQYAFALLSGTHDPVSMTVKSLSSGQQATHVLSLNTWDMDANPDVLDSLGLIPFIPSVPPVIGEVLSGSPAEVTGLRIGDVIKSANGHAISDWGTLVDYVKAHPEKRISLHIERHGEPLTVNVMSSAVMNDGKAEGRLGLRSEAPTRLLSRWYRTFHQAPLPAIRTAFLQTLHLTGNTFVLMGRLITGNLSWHNISGPIGIAQVVGTAAQAGISSFLFFLAMISISLAVLNVLPIPMLDGGHLLYYAIEIIFRRSVPDVVKSVGTYIGVGLLAMLMVIAVFNDLTRLMG